ncbi:MAG TPA: M28 family peptidase [Gemmatimonadaceae bacterium]
MSRSDARELLTRLGASARPAGSSAEAAARELCAERLRQAGFEIEERPFSYSAFPGLWGTPLAGAALLLTSVGTGLSLLRAEPQDGPLARALTAVLIIGLAGWWLGRYGTRRLPFMRREGLNLEARRGVPTVWLTAHLDSKSQLVSLLTRAAATVALCVGWGCLAIVFGLSHFFPIPAGVPLSLIATTAIAALPLSLAIVGTNGSGVLDNATGVASIVLAARELGGTTPIGLVITSAEELGLAGARAWVEGKPRAVAINCDGVDDIGMLSVTAGAPGRKLWRRHQVAGVFGPEVRIRESIPGVLLDSTAFSDRGWAACTISQGTIRSLARIHTRRDGLDECTGKGVDGAARLIAALAGAIIAEGKNSE